MLLIEIYRLLGISFFGAQYTSMNLRIMSLLIYEFLYNYITGLGFDLNSTEV